MTFGTDTSEAIDRLETLREKILSLAPEVKYGADVRLKRVIRMLDVLRLQTIESKRAVLNDLGVVVTRQVVDSRLTVVARIHGKERILRTETVSESSEAHVRHTESPDGSSAVGLFDELDDLEAEAEDAEETDTAYAYTLEAEWLQTEYEIMEFLNQQGGLSCPTPEPADAPDGSTSAPRLTSESDDCIEYGVAALMGAGSVVQRVWDKISQNGGGLNTLKLMLSGLRGQIAAGAITVGAALDLAVPLVADFIVGLNIGWVLTGVAVAGAGFFAYKMFECYGLFLSPAELTAVS